MGPGTSVIRNPVSKKKYEKKKMRYLSCGLDRSIGLSRSSQRQRGESGDLGRRPAGPFGGTPQG